MEKTLTIDLPVEQVAKVVKRHLVYPSSSPSLKPDSSSIPSPRKPSSQQQQQHKEQHEHTQQQQRQQQDQQQQNYLYNTHHLLPSGAILDDIYKWTAQIDHLEQKKGRRQSISLPATRTSTTEPLLLSLKQPGGFRRHFVLTKAVQQGKRPPHFVTSSFVEFLCLYGHFGGEDLSETDESSSDDDDDTDDDQHHSSESSEAETFGGEIRNERMDQHSTNQRQTRQLQEDDGDVMAYRGPLLHDASLPSITHQQKQKQRYGTVIPPDTSPETRGSQPTTSSPSKTLATTSVLPFPVSTLKKNGEQHQPLQYRHLHARETMPLLSRSRPGQTLQGKATPGKAMFLLLKSFVTTGIMFLPKAFENGGLLFSILVTIAWALISLWSFLLLVQTRLVIPASFSDMGCVLYGPKMRMAVLVAITLSQIGFVCAYMVFVAENLQSLVLTFSKCRLMIPMHLLILAQSFAFIPLAMIRKIQRLSVFALIADVFIVIGLAYLFYYDIKELSTVGVADTVSLWNYTHFPLFIGTCAFTYEGIGLVIPITESMKEPQQFPAVLRRALFIITCLFISMSALSYMTFGDQVQTIILLNLPSKDPMVSSIQTLYSLAICLSIPLQLFPAIRIMENGLFTTRSGKNNAVVKWQKNVFRVLVVFLCAWIGIVGSKDKLDKFVPLIGALFCIPLCFVFPPLFHLRALSLPLYGVLPTTF
ncbi:transmembrane amino acid transporter protein-domain-containing protein [Absidia repens]|uniref:Transmembrane amino acid transporter protein-domain-containing protein n=1 Tax=Absidia repens TaxID=90262 RepID=A0A1X2J3R5_9FUNG|nr:transmembrane amino acid transporter protein-domain-containing protein [Absidia repens]